MSNIVTITAGHSNTDSGAVNGSDRESDIAQDMRNIVAYYLRAKGINIRTDGEGKEMRHYPAVNLIAGSKIAVEFHCNAASSKVQKVSGHLRNQKTK